MEFKLFVYDGMKQQIFVTAEPMTKQDAAKTPELAMHYERDFGALPIPGRRNGGVPRYLICDEAARDIFISYLEEN